MKYIKIIIYLCIGFTFIYVILNLNKSMEIISLTLINFFKSLLPYLLTFLIINQLLIKTKIIYLLSSMIEFFVYPMFKVNSKEISLIIISFLNGFPSSFIYGEIMKKENDLNDKQLKRICPIFFLPSYPFIFFVLKNNLPIEMFSILSISLYLPTIIMLALTRYKSESKYIGAAILKEIKYSMNNFNFIQALKEIVINSFFTIINILGTITFYSLTTISIPNLFMKGLFEFSIPSINILNSNYYFLTKTYLLLIILSFSSISSLTQASIYLESTNIKINYFIKKRITLLFLSLSIFNLILFFYSP